MSVQAATERSGTGVSALSPPGFAGRQRELAALAGALDCPPAVVLVEGEAGVGKSRLVREFLAFPAAKTGRSLVACCPPFRQPCTLGPVADALRQAAGDVAGLRLSPLAGSLRPLLPEWAAGLPPAPEPLEDAGAARYRLYRALAEVLDCLRVRVLVAEDAHWADDATLEFLLFLAARQREGFSLVVTWRPEDVPAGSLLRRLSSRLPAGTTSARITLAPLDVAATAALVSSMLDGKPVSQEFAAFLHQRTDGLPLAVEETVRLMADRADLERRGGGWARRRLADIAVPPTVRDAVLERAGRLDSGAQAVLRAAAVLAVPASEPVLLAVSGLPGGQADGGLAGALRCGLLTEEQQPNGQALVCFRHALAARAVYEAIPARQRQQLHLRAAQALEGETPLPVAWLARHFREAGQAAQWCSYGEQAADLALATGDQYTAAALLHELVTRTGLPARDAARLTAKIPLPLLDPPDASLLTRALRASLGSGDPAPEEEGQVRCQLGRVLVAMDDWNAAPAELERAIPYLAHDPVAAARAMTLLGLPIGWTDWPASKHARWLRRAAEVSTKMPPAEELPMRVNRITALLMLGEEEGWAEAARIPDDALAAAERVDIIRGHLNIGEAAMLWGRYAEADRRLAKARHLAETHGHLRLRDKALVMQAHLGWSTGAWKGLGKRAEGLAMNEDIPPLPRLKAGLVRGLLHTAAAAHASAEGCLTHVMTEARGHGSVEDFMEAAGALARLRLADGRYREALEVTDEPAGIVARKQVWLWAADIAPARVGALLAAGRDAEAATLVTAFARGIRGRDAPAPQAALLLCRALLAGAAGQHGRAAAAFGRAAAAWQALPRPYDALLARERQGLCLLAAGQDQDALDLLAQAFQGLSGLGASGDASRVMRTLRDNGVQARTRRAGRRSYGDQLSPRELEVVRLLVTGHSDREIAQELFLSPHTVVRHVDSARRKLNVPSRIALAVTAVESGLLSGQPDPGAA